MLPYTLSLFALHQRPKYYMIRKDYNKNCNKVR